MAMTNPTSCRAAFEKWLFESGFYGEYDHVISRKGVYDDSQTEAQWIAWQAACEWMNTRATEGEAVAWMHTMHCELGQAMTRLSDSPKHPFGVADEDYSAEFAITSQPLYTNPPTPSVDVDELHGAFAECYISPNMLELLRSEALMAVVDRVKTKYSTVPLYTHPPRATSVEDTRDAARYRWLREQNAILDDEADDAAEGKGNG